ncbi:hypothetical protein HNQ59_000212 [Chitinivorax tropicus]|uniref:Uncharacterized protein n=1 Tax=Chitinivorax tropicus TaxID=714531 RepID=A0A840MEY2_9PROT|nr:hypothetical protein [Chitinivorax tropicus]MBB5016950.1 hypothetical protein [Chitinivorax tropicus]
MKSALIPVALIVIGLAWLLDEFHVFPEVNWFWITALTAAGVAVLLLDGINKSSVVVGPLLIGGGITTFLRQYLDLRFGAQWSVLMILLGVLMLVARSPSIPEVGNVGRLLPKSSRDET